jgi:molecular chaperone HtpG
VETQLAHDVKTVRFSTRLSDSPAVLLSDENAISPHMERLLRASNQDPPREKRILELNPDHAVVKKLLSLHAADPKAERFHDWVEWIHGQTLLAEGSPLPDAARFAKLMTKLVT